MEAAIEAFCDTEACGIFGGETGAQPTGRTNTGTAKNIKLAAE